MGIVQGSAGAVAQLQVVAATGLFGFSASTATGVAWLTGYAGLQGALFSYAYTVASLAITAVTPVRRRLKPLHDDRRLEVDAEDHILEVVQDMRALWVDAEDRVLEVVHDVHVLSPRDD